MNYFVALDLSWNLAEINSELPDELNCQPVSNTKKAEDTIQKNHNLSQLLSAHSDVHPGSSYFGGSTNPLPPRAATFTPPQFRQQFSSQLSHQPCPVVNVRGGAGALPSARHQMAANNLHLQNQMGTGFGLRQGSYGAMRPMSGGTTYVSNNLRNLNGSTYPYGNNVVAMTPGGGFCSNQFPPPGGANDNPYCNQLVMGGKTSMQTNGSAVHRPCDDLKNTLSVVSSGAVVNSQTGLNSVDPGVLTSKSSTTRSSSIPNPVVASPLSGVVRIALLSDYGAVLAVLMFHLVM